MTQLRRHSLLESCLNTASGFLVSFSLWPVVCRFILHEPFRPARGVGVIAFFTVLSVLRNYLWRRIFNRRIRPADGGAWPPPEYLVGTEPGRMFSDAESAAWIARLRQTGPVLHLVAKPTDTSTAEHSNDR